MGERGSRFYARLGSSLDEGKEGVAMFELVLFQETKKQSINENIEMKGEIAGSAASPMITRSRVVFFCFRRRWCLIRVEKENELGRKGKDQEVSILGESGKGNGKWRLKRERQEWK